MTVTTFRDLRASGAIEFGDGYRTKRSEHGLPGFRILRAADIEGGRVRQSGIDFVALQHRAAIGPKLCQPGDVVLTTKGTVGRVAQIPRRVEASVYSPQLCYFRVLDSSVIDPGFLASWFRSPNFSAQSSHLANSTDMAAYINLRDIGSLRIHLPEIRSQRAIAEVLGSLDDKIAANNRLVAAADELARAEWVRACSDGELRPLSSLGRFVNGRAFTKGASGSGRVVIRIAELNSGVGASTVFNDIDVADEHLARPGDLLFAWSGSLTVARWFREEAVINQHIFKCVPEAGLSVAALNQAVRSGLGIFRGIAADKATTMGHIQRKHLDLPVRVPEPDALRRATAVPDALWARALAAEQETVSLTRTRDSLLPLLMSGNLQVADVETPASGAFGGSSC